ncbi:MAG: radical SAM protein [Deltaproteobacteria bacterium]|nr:radical SAM protein [Deltaproteobacteria bacterium]
MIARGLRPGQARLAARLLLQGLYRDDRPWPELLASLPRRARPHLAELCTPPVQLQVDAALRSDDGALKLRLRAADGHLFETAVYRSSTGRRATVCVSSQVGCGRRCAFCQTGRMGLVRNLTAGEIVAQWRTALREWTSADGPRPTRIAFMGMGEPLDNLAAVGPATHVLSHPWAAAVPWRRITVSTSGVAWRLPRFFAEVRAQLAVSFNAPDDARRRILMPVNAHAGLGELRQTLLDHLPAGRTLLGAYVLIATFTELPADADLLADWLQGLPARVNLIPANAGPTPGLNAPSEAAIQAFADRLRARGLRVLFRRCKGAAIAAACGQLAAALPPATAGKATAAAARPTAP